uniref:CFA20 domain-containing protein n=1 Tax=Cucumis sativus TaxID=3659 RepID=A0A0A0KTS7_CUCSA
MVSSVGVTSQLNPLSLVPCPPSGMGVSENKVGYGTLKSGVGILGLCLTFFAYVFFGREVAGVNPLFHVVGVDSGVGKWSRCGRHWLRLELTKWTSRGLEGKDKRRLVKEVLSQECSDIVKLMESKRSKFCSKRIASIWKRMRVKWENSRSCVATEVVRGRHSITIAFLDNDGEEFWVTKVYGPLRIRARGLFWEELGDFYGYCGPRWCVFIYESLFDPSLIRVSNGHIKRPQDEDIQSNVLEIVGSKIQATYITCPADPASTLGIKLPFLVIIVKNLNKYFTFEIQVLDDKNVRRRFRASNFQAITRVKPYICTMPLRMDEGWNHIQLNLADFTRRAYGTNYVETLRVQVHANCRLRRIYFADRLYSEEELPPEFKLYLPTQRA